MDSPLFSTRRHHSDTISHSWGVRRGDDDTNKRGLGDNGIKAVFFPGVETDSLFFLFGRNRIIFLDDDRLVVVEAVVGS